MNNNLTIQISAYSSKGDRRYQEDRVSVLNDKSTGYAYFGVFDGHGGFEAANFAEANLRRYIIEQEIFWSADDSLVLQAIKNGFIRTHRAMQRAAETWPETPYGDPSTAGTTASIVFFKNRKVFIGHAGDSGIVMGAENLETGAWTSQALTVGHKPEAPKELRRITEAGGKVANSRVVWARRTTKQGGAEINEIPFLAIARSLGDFWSYNRHKNEFVVSPDPDVSVLDLESQNQRCFILATDGLWDVLTPQDAVNLVHSTENENKKRRPFIQAKESMAPENFLNPSKTLVDRALDCWRQKNFRADNTSVVTVIINPQAYSSTSAMLISSERISLDSTKIKSLLISSSTANPPKLVPATKTLSKPAIVLKESRSSKKLEIIDAVDPISCKIRKSARIADRKSKEKNIVQECLNKSKDQLVRRKRPQQQNINKPLSVFDGFRNETKLNSTTSFAVPFKKKKRT